MIINGYAVNRNARTGNYLVTDTLNARYLGRIERHQRPTAKVGIVDFLPILPWEAVAERPTLPVCDRLKDAVEMLARHAWQE